ncbi:tRNA 2-thiouridine(34) synthase MnmA [Scatolibacter rhodanostii]|uniref:tRNA 2-thiouridine(34) synthase MnmA n=1 Tax=Scatolibacter rhodanostii TaxID=2014781 RepID=UPI000C06B648|nr:tRNA 2-thiouridine(34) synthase MnmA [Scatolibacter rhodanostii]
MTKKAVIAMSGGVDSSTAALLTQEMGYETIGITLKLYTNEGICLTKTRTCCSLDDVEDARAVAAKLDMPFYVLNFTDDFEENVIERFVEAYESGYTPNPCIDCNRYIKFQSLLTRAEKLGFDYIVTGHYSRIEQDKVTGRYLLKKGLDDTKDQSYMLYTLTQEQLAKTLFPLGNMRKEHVREIAEEHGLVNARKRDSQDICFVPDGDYAGFIKRYKGIEFKPGNFVGTNGQIYGQHKGIIHYTIGQRKGLGISFPQPMFVGGIDTVKNEVLLCKAEELFSTELIARDINLISCERIDEPMRVLAKVRYRHKEQPATVIQTGEDEIKIVFDEPQRAITNGQAVVMYQDDVVVGGGIIKETQPVRADYTGD